MPYIRPENREPIEERIEQLVKHLQGLPVEAQDGALNYTLTRIIKELYKEGYNNYNRAVGVLENVKQEFYRRSVAPYEDKKIAENGDV